jgi:hypothetical protein
MSKRTTRNQYAPLQVKAVQQDDGPPNSRLRVGEPSARQVYDHHAETTERRQDPLGISDRAG